MKNSEQKDKKLVLSSDSDEKIAISTFKDVEDAFLKKEFLKDVKSAHRLIVRTQFRDYKKGDVIVDAEEIKKVEACHERGMVVKVTVKG